MTSSSHRVLLIRSAAIAGILLMFLGACFADSPTSETLFLEKLDQLRYSFPGMWSLDRHSFEDSWRRERHRIDWILSYASHSEGNLNFCFSRVSDMFAAYYNQFRPGVPVKQELLEKISGAVPIREDPVSGLGVLSYLLVEFAEIRQSAKMTKETLNILYQAYVSSCYMGLCLGTHKFPENDDIREQKDKMNRGEGIYDGGKPSMEIALCCQRLMRQLAETKPAYLPASALAVCESFKKRDATERLDPIHDFHKIMKYVAQLIKEL